MPEFENLVKRLRENAEFLTVSDRQKAPPNVRIKNLFAETMHDAADAIEKMRQRWIPATERLPEEKINPNTHDFEYVLCATVFGDVRPFKFGTRIGETQPHFWNGAGYADAYINHWMPLPELPKGETND